MRSVSSRIGMPLGLCPRQDEGLEARDGGKNRCRARRPRESRPGPEGGRDREEPGHSPALCCPPRGNGSKRIRGMQDVELGGGGLGQQRQAPAADR